MRGKEHGLETGGACVGNTLGACGEEDFPCKYRPFRIKPVLPLHRQRDEVDVSKEMITFALDDES